MPKYPVNPAVVIAAREELGLDRESAAALLKISPEYLSELESGSRQPDLSLVRRMASKYRVSLAALFMPAPLLPFQKPRDFRTVGGEAPGLSADTLLAIRTASELQEIASDLVAEAPDLHEPQELPEPSLSDDASQLAATERARLSVSVEDQLSWPTASDAFRYWRWRIESLGILVFLIRMPRADCRAFSLWRERALIPTIVINGVEVDQAKSFSLFHEYAHLLLRRPGMCNERERDVDEARLERFCNRFAAHLLMPEQAVREALRLTPPVGRPGDWTIDELAKVARRLWVSRPALALRLEEMGLAQSGFYDWVDANLGAEIWSGRIPGGGRLKHHERRLRQFGGEFTSIVLGALQKGIVDPVGVDEVLGTTSRHLPALESSLEAQRQRYAALG